MLHIKQNPIFSFLNTVQNILLGSREVRVNPIPKGCWEGEAVGDRGTLIYSLKSFSATHVLSPVLSEVSAQLGRVQRYRIRTVYKVGEFAK